MLTNKVCEAIRHHPGPRMLWVMSCLAPGDYLAQLSQCRLMLSRCVSIHGAHGILLYVGSNDYDAIGLFSTSLSLWKDMAVWVAAWLEHVHDIHSTSHSIFEAMLRAQRSVTGKTRLVAVLVGAIPEEVVHAMSQDQTAIAAEPDDMAMDIDPPHHPSAVDAVQFWETGSKRQVWTSSVLTTAGERAMGCGGCGATMRGHNVRRFGKSLAPMECESEACSWKSAYIALPPIVRLGEYRTAAHKGPEHRYLWHGVFPMPRLLTEQIASETVSGAESD
jgi:hypothetical protein